ncbi:putative GroES-like superfamily, alcohol dehydrogenase-like, NAD(P)-binding domain superfamily [Septoria linicola]|nr:putative GroES-like superfamily, alcohol dehydrogenase-like, NAD(P)-binding domain superfamily [Septoria linicola]
MAQVQNDEKRLIKAARYYGQHDIRIDRVEEPKPGDGQVIVDVEWCGICGSDLHEYIMGPSIALPTKDRPAANGVHIPVTLGHELCGRVRGAPPGSRLKDGDAVMVDPRVTCHSCLPCKAGQSYCCSKLGYVGGNTGFGGYGETVVVDEDSLHVLPPQVPLEYAAVIEPLVIVNHAIKVSGVTNWKDRDVLVLGGGPIGFALLLILKALGACQVMVSEPTSTRRAQVSDFARTTINPLEDNVAQRIHELTDGRGVEVVFDCAGVPAGLESGMDALRHHGLYMMVAVWEKPITIPCWKFLAKHITMKGTLIFGDGDIEEVIDMMATGKLEGYERMVTGRIALDDIVEQGFEELLNNKDAHIKILVRPR